MSVETEKSSPLPTDKIKPFKNQVGGHTLFFRLETKICKKFIQNEFFFYSSLIDQDLKNFVPKFYGKIDVKTSKLCQYLNTTNSPVTKEETTKNWNFSIFEKFKKEDMERTNSFIILQDLTSDFKLPCILDLKLGTRIHGDEIDEEKKKSQILKAKTTTSNTYGIRVCGVKKFDSKLNQFIIKDKYQGRKIKDEELIENIRDYFHNGNKIRVDIIDLILIEIEKLHKILKEQKRYIFYGSSLLFIYDANEECTKYNVKLVDFANTLIDSEQEDDSGIVYGIENLISILKSCK